MKTKKLINNFIQLKLFFFLSFITFNQYSDAYVALSEIRAIKDSIYNDNLSAEIRSDCLMHLIHLYEKDTSSLSLYNIEATIMGLTYFSSLYFYHEFEEKLRLEFRAKKLNSNIDKIKCIRLFFILSLKYPDIDYYYYNTALKLKDADSAISFFQMQSISCDSNAYNKESLRAAIKRHEINNVVDTYIGLLYYCKDLIPTLLKYRREFLAYPSGHD